MSISYKVIGQAVSIAGTNVPVYSVPLGKQTTLSTICVCNQGLSTTFRLFVHNSNEPITSKNYVIYESTIGPNETAMFTIGMTLESFKTVSLRAATSNVSINLFGCEEDILSITSEPPTIGPWVRNPDWKTLPSISPGTQKVQLLFRVMNSDVNYCAFLANGNYTVDWGDGGSTENIAGNVQAQHNYVYSNVTGTVVGSSNSIPVTFTDSGDTVNLIDHRLQNGTIVAFSSITSTTGVSTNTDYYVVQKTADNFKLSTTLGGSAITLTTDGSGNYYIPLYKTAIITITPNGSNITTLDLDRRHSAVAKYYDSNLLSIDINLSYLTTLTIVKSSTSLTWESLVEVKISENAVINFSYLLYTARSVESLDLNTSSGTNFSYMFGYCYSLKTIPLIDTSLGTNFSGMFSNCPGLLTIPLIDTSLGTNFNAMFISCSSLITIPLIDTGAGTDFGDMFKDCAYLDTIPLIDTGNGTLCYSMFQGCIRMKSVPLLNFSKNTNFFGMFWGNKLLIEVPLFDTSAATSVSNLFYQCFNLRSVPLFNTSLVTNFSSMFSNCYSLETVPLLDTSAGTNFSSMFDTCTALKSIPLFNTANGTTFDFMFYKSRIEYCPPLNTVKATSLYYMFHSCLYLQRVPLLDASIATNVSSMLSYCYSLTEGALLGTKISISYLNCSLDATALNDIYTNLATVTAKTITVTGNPGTASDNPSIATAKGWTVTG